MKKRSRILVLILTAMLSTEPVQIVYAETAEATPVTSESTSVNPKEENADNSAVVPPKADPGWVAVEKGYQWRQEDGTLLQKSGWVIVYVGVEECTAHILHGFRHVDFCNFSLALQDFERAFQSIT